MEIITLPCPPVEALSDAFNAAHADKLLIFADDATIAEDKKDRSVLKSMITEPYSIIEYKGKDSIPVKSCSRIIMATNENWAAPVDLYDRRYFVLDVDPVAKYNKEFFVSLHKEMEDQGPNALMSYLQGINLDGFDVKTFPDTLARKRQKLYSMSPLHLWWFEVLIPGSEIAMNQGLSEFEDSSIRKSYILVAMNSYCREHQKNFKQWSSAQFAMEFRELVPNLKTYRNGSNPREWLIPSLEKCRDYFKSKFGVGFDEDLFVN